MKANKVKRLRKVQIIKELASMGFYGAQIARQCGISGEYLLKLKREFRFTTPPQPQKGSALYQAVKAGILANKPARQIAEETGTTTKTVNVYANRMKLTRTRDWKAIKRGFAIPPERRAEYMELTDYLGCTPQEAGMCMGLIPRPTAGVTLCVSTPS